MEHPQYGGVVQPDSPVVDTSKPVEIIVRDGKHPCVKFELDLKNEKGGYGYCFCGFTRLDHESFHHDPEEWHRIRQGLTAPKEFE